MYELVGKPWSNTTAGASRRPGLAEEESVSVDGDVAVMNHGHERFLLV